MRDVNELLIANHGLTIRRAFGINVAGAIVGEATDGNGVSHAVLLTPDGVTDTVSPATSATGTGSTGSNGWYGGPVTVTLSATDNPGGSGVAASYYTVDGGATQTYSGPFSVSGDAIHTVSYWSVDRAGNEEQPHPTQSIQI